MTRLDQNRAKAQIASKLGIAVDDVKNVIIWGNHSSTQFPDVCNATATVGGVKKSVNEAIGNVAYLQNDTRNNLAPIKHQNYPRTLCWNNTDV